MDKATETTSKPAVSFDVFAMSKEGYEIHFQLSGERAYCHALKLLEAMSKDGFKPRPSKPAFTPKVKSDGAPKGNGADPASGEVCPVHNVPMRAHHNDKGTWHSHKLDDGTWCNGKAA